MLSEVSAKLGLRAGRLSLRSCLTGPKHIRNSLSGWLSLKIFSIESLRAHVHHPGLDLKISLGFGMYES